MSLYFSVFTVVYLQTCCKSQYIPHIFTLFLPPGQAALHHVVARPEVVWREVCGGRGDMADTRYWRATGQ